MAETFGLSLPDLQDTVVSEAFADALMDAAASNLATGYEVGYSVYRTPDGPSEPVLLRAQDTPDFGEDYLDISGIVKTPDGTLRTDLGLMGHTHPYRHIGSALPSGPDLRSFTLINNERPGIIDSVATLRLNLGIVSLMLFRGRTSQQLKVIRRPFNILEGKGWDATLTAISKSGAVHHTITYDFQTGRLLDSPAHLSHLYDS